MKLILIYGASGTGKYTIAKELEKLTGYTLFHNHILLNALSDRFGFHHSARKKLEKEFRLRVIEEAINADLDLIVTGVIMRDNESLYRQMIQLVKKAGGECLTIYLTADRQVIRTRIANESRKSMKKISTVERFEAFTSQYPECFEKVDFKNQYEFDTTKPSPAEIARAIKEGL